MSTQDEREHFVHGMMEAQAAAVERHRRMLGTMTSETGRGPFGITPSPLQPGIVLPSGWVAEVFDANAERDQFNRQSLAELIRSSPRPYRPSVELPFTEPTYDVTHIETLPIAREMIPVIRETRVQQTFVHQYSGGRPLSIDLSRAGPSGAMSVPVPEPPEHLGFDAEPIYVDGQIVGWFDDIPNTQRHQRMSMSDNVQPAVEHLLAANEILRRRVNDRPDPPSVVLSPETLRRYREIMPTGESREVEHIPLDQDTGFMSNAEPVTGSSFRLPLTPEPQPPTDEQMEWARHLLADYVANYPTGITIADRTPTEDIELANRMLRDRGYQPEQVLRVTPEQYERLRREGESAQRYGPPSSTPSPGFLRGNVRVVVDRDAVAFEPGLPTTVGMTVAAYDGDPQQGGRRLDSGSVEITNASGNFVSSNSGYARQPIGLVEGGAVQIRYTYVSSVVACKGLLLRTSPDSNRRKMVLYNFTTCLGMFQVIGFKLHVTLVLLGFNDDSNWDWVPWDRIPPDKEVQRKMRVVK